MALPPRRAANRGIARRNNGSDRGRMATGERPLRDDSPGPGMGSPFARYRQGSGSIAGAGELNTTPHKGPGRAAERYAGMGKDEFPSRPIASDDTPRGDRGYREE